MITGLQVGTSKEKFAFPGIGRIEYLHYPPTHHNDPATPFLYTCRNSQRHFNLSGISFLLPSRPTSIHCRPGNSIL